MQGMDGIIRSPRRPKIDLGDGQEADVQVAALPATPLVPVASAAEESSEGPAKAPEDTPPTNKNDTPPPQPPKKPRKFAWKVPTPKTKKQWIIAIIIMALLLGGTATAVYWFIIRDTSPVVQQAAPEPEPEPLPEPIYSRMTGREITSADINKRPVYAVQIENSPEARPQSGLRDADIVFEAVAEGGITRFNAIYHDNIPANIGPVRSLRPYYIDWFLPFDAAIVHAGGSGEALADVRSLRLKDMDSVASIMRRISERYSPHNYYTRGQQVLDLANQRGYTSTFTSLPRKQPVEQEASESATDKTVPPAAPAAGTVNVRISSTLYNVRYVYDAASKTYLREQGGGKHVDADSGTQLAPSVVIVPIMGKRIHPDGVHTQYTTVGSGKVYVFQGGSVTEGTWSKSSRSAQWELRDGNGDVIELEPGQTWFTITDAASNVTYAP